MREHTVYFADDGTEFSTKEECLKYEEEYMSQFHHLQECVHAYDEHGQRIYFINEDDFMKKYGLMTYLVIEQDYPEKLASFLDIHGYYPIPNTRGIYYYPPETCGWVKFNKAWSPIMKIIKEWY